MSARVLLLEGDGISAELLPWARRLLESVAPQLELVSAPIGFGAFQRTGASLPPATLEAARRAQACLMVAVGSPLTPTPGYTSPVVALRRELDLFANLRPVCSLPEGARGEGVGAQRRPSRPVDLLVVRENTEGLYIGREHTEGSTRAVAQRVVTARASRRIARVAGELARARRRRVTVVHKSNVLRETCGLFRQAALDELSVGGGLQVDELLVDHAAYRLAAEPESFDVLVTTNLFGDILSDLAAHAGGGLGLVASANVGECHALFEPVHGSAPDLVGRGSANPVATLRACAMLLKHLGLGDAGARVEAAIEHSLASGPRTPDLGGSASTEDVARAILASATREGASRQPACDQEHPADPPPTSSWSWAKSIVS